MLNVRDILIYLKRGCETKRHYHIFLVKCQGKGTLSGTLTQNFLVVSNLEVTLCIQFILGRHEYNHVDNTDNTEYIKLIKFV